MLVKIAHITILFFYFSVSIFANEKVLQTYIPVKLHRITSVNGKFFLTSIPYASDSKTGSTTVYFSDSTKLYEIKRFFPLSDGSNEMIISNDGRKLALIKDICSFKPINIPINVNSILINLFLDGILIKSLQAKDLIDFSKEKNGICLFYNGIDSVSRQTGNVYRKQNLTNLEKQLKKQSLYISNDTVYLFSNYNRLIYIDLNSFQLTIGTFDPNDENILRNLKVKKKETEELVRDGGGAYSQKYKIPHLSDGTPFNLAFLDHFGMMEIPDELKNSYKHRRYSLSFTVFIDRSGKCYFDSIDFNYGNFSILNLKNFTEQCSFDITGMPPMVDRWRFTGSINFMNKDLKLAKKERKKEIKELKEEYRRNLIAD